MKKYMLGLFSGIIAIPLLEALLELILMWIEVGKIKPSLIIMDWNKEIGADEPQNDTYAIGFQIPNSDEECEDEDDY